MAPTGMGKSFIAKKEITPLFLGDPNANIIIIDPQGEYKKLVDGLNKYSKKKECQILPVNSTSVGSNTGKSFLSTGTIPQSSQ